jgi:hypothetical protein
MLTRDDIDLIASQLELLKSALQGQTHDPPAQMSTQSERELLAFLDAASNEAWMTDRIRVLSGGAARQRPPGRVVVGPFAQVARAPPTAQRASGRGLRRLPSAFRVSGFVSGRSC